MVKFAWGRYKFISLSSVYIVIFSVCWENVLLEAFRPFPAATRALTKATVRHGISTNDNPLFSVSCTYVYRTPFKAWIKYRSLFTSSRFHFVTKLLKIYGLFTRSWWNTKRIWHKNTICSCRCLYQEQSLRLRRRTALCRGHSRGPRRTWMLLQQWVYQKLQPQKQNRGTAPCSTLTNADVSPETFFLQKSEQWAGTSPRKELRSDVSTLGQRECLFWFAENVGQCVCVCHTICCHGATFP
jgi:hypothetical protein